MPTHEELAQFMREYLKLTVAEQDRFIVAMKHMVDDARAGKLFSPWATGEEGARARRDLRDDLGAGWACHIPLWDLAQSWGDSYRLAAHR